METFKTNVTFNGKVYPVAGSCDPKFNSARDRFIKNFEDGLEIGACIALNIEGTPVIDMWGGYKDKAQTKAWENDTIVNMMSVSKAISGICIYALVDRGLVDPEAPVAKYWPEFAANGKEGVLVRHLMAHTAGLSGWQEKVAAEDLYDWEKCTSLLAAQEPWWEPGSCAQ